MKLKSHFWFELATVTVTVTVTIPERILGILINKSHANVSILSLKGPARRFHWHYTTLSSPSWLLLKTLQFKATASGWYLLLSRLNWWSLVNQHWYTWYLLLYLLCFDIQIYSISNLFRCHALCFQSSFTPFLMGYCVNSGTGHFAYDYNEVDKSRWNRPQILESESTDQSFNFKTFKF